MKRQPPAIVNPCGFCPFRNDQEPFGLGHDRATEIAESLILGNGSVFPCHKTLDYDQEDHKQQDWLKRTIPCAGACVTTYKTLGDFNGVMQIGQRLGVFNLDELNHDAPVYESMEEFIEANSE